jgi:2-amino-4-hydroxy-6-hydroxymethyldihydropteridine diphosphokinase
MKVGLGLGSNVGDRLLHLQQAKSYLLSLSPEQWHHASPLYESEPVDCPSKSAKFLNAVLEIEFSGAPKTLLEKILAYEAAYGRDRSAGANAPRTIDIDILYCGEMEILENGLVVPHPRIAARRFVLLPLSTICPERIVKGAGRTVMTLFRELPVGVGDVRFVQQDW